MVLEPSADRSRPLQESELTANPKRQRCDEVASSQSSEEDADGSASSAESSDGGSASGNDASVGEPWQDALAAFHQRFDPKAQVHGSRALGLAAADSDLDVLVSVPLQRILSLVRRKSCGFVLVRSVPTARVPRVLLRHKRTQVLVDAVEAVRDPHALAKDALVNRWLLIGGEVPAFVRLLRTWARSHEDQLPREEGYPNSFLLLLSGLWYLRNRAGFRGPGDDTSATSTAQPASAASALELFRGWLKFVAEGSNPPRLLDLRSDSERQQHSSAARPAGWAVVEPISGRIACSLRPQQVQHLADLAASTLAVERVQG
eukprot:gnl/TRDRNA2_/TRDRNA2_89028_c0_seq1.p1 gnl/TRDRNA2_/TRDRNA2_89028_c0~~gnl/TRDRNA2_/TRDRNA2_89028_c0_seq1.p1  ORF type:complete len:317 (-),score=46.32 gnl/TRDRNA2_/TRDRNA2_89028_c0_seq1:91-1041(-)